MLGDTSDNFRGHEYGLAVPCNGALYASHHITDAEGGLLGFTEVNPKR